MWKYFYANDRVHTFVITENILHHFLYKGIVHGHVFIIISLILDFSWKYFQFKVNASKIKGNNSHLKSALNQY